MPVTPFHFGPGAAIYALAPKHVSFIAFCGANVLMDVEPLYYMLTHQYPLHRFLHTYVGATVATLAAVVLLLACLRFAKRVQLPNPFQWQQLGLLAIVLGAALGVYSHIVLDSIMHPDIVPLAPFSNANALYGVISLRALHLFSLGAGLLGLGGLAIRHRLGSSPE